MSLKLNMQLMNLKKTKLNYLATNSLFAFALGISPNHCIAKSILKISNSIEYANNHMKQPIKHKFM